MRTIKPIALKDAKILSTEEMKHLFGGSAAKEENSSGCYLKCGSKVILNTDLEDCNICMASGNAMFCKKTADADYIEKYTCKPSGTYV